ncbi:MAG: helix-turn-helix domain-containing protein, partial [Myxococcota bacterium]
ALDVLKCYAWPGNIRELENVLERTMLFCDNAIIDADDLPTDLVERSNDLPIPSIHLPAGGDTGLKEVVKETTSRIEREYIMRALDETGGNVTQAAKRLKISRKSLQNKMKDLGLREDY